MRINHNEDVRQEYKYIAKDAYIHGFTPIEDAIARINLIEEYSKKAIDNDKELESLIMFLKERIKCEEKKCRKWPIPKGKEIIISPSDVGIHNMLENEGSYKYIDFEYSGKDDIAKLCLDFVQQPNHANKHRDAEKWLLEKMTKFDPESSETDRKVLHLEKYKCNKVGMHNYKEQ